MSKPHPETGSVFIFQKFVEALSEQPLDSFKCQVKHNKEWNPMGVYVDVDIGSAGVDKLLRYKVSVCPVDDSSTSGTPNIRVHVCRFNNANVAKFAVAREFVDSDEEALDNQHNKSVKELVTLIVEDMKEYELTQLLLKHISYVELVDAIHRNENDPEWRRAHGYPDLIHIELDTGAGVFPVRKTPMHERGKAY